MSPVVTLCSEMRNIQKASKRTSRWQILRMSQDAILRDTLFLLP
jgi:hypothetical protein